jgi:hypothetical protein
MSTLHIFIDESGNFDFTPKGSRYFILTAVSTVGCGPLYSGFYELKHELAGSGIDVEEFHATEDKQPIRDRMYDFLEGHCAHSCFTVDSVIAQKNKANPSIREPPDFYARMLKILLQYVLRSRVSDGIEKVVVWAAQIHTHRKRAAFEKTVKTYLTREMEVRVPYSIFLHGSVSHPLLQVADYCCWAVAKKWKDNELRPYEKIRQAIKTEFEVFRIGSTEYY